MMYLTMKYLSEAIVWFVIGGALGLALGEGIFRIRRTASRNRR